MQSRGKVCKRPAGAFMNTPFTAWRRPHAQGREQEKAEGRPLFPSRRRRDWGCGGQSPRKTVEHHKIFGHAYARNRAGGGNAVGGRSAAKAAARAQLAASRRAFKSLNIPKISVSRTRGSRRWRQRRQRSQRGAGGGAGAARGQPPGFQISEHPKNFGHAYARNRADGGNAVSGRSAAQAAARAQLAASRRTSQKFRSRVRAESRRRRQRGQMLKYQLEWFILI